MRRKADSAVVHVTPHVVSSPLFHVRVVNFWSAGPAQIKLIRKMGNTISVAHESEHGNVIV